MSKRPLRTLGISCHYHDAAACLVEDGVIVAAAQEERFTRKKHDEAMPVRAMRYCLAEASGPEIDAVAFYEKPILKLHRILETALGTAPRGLVPFVHAVPSMLGGKLFVESEIHGALESLKVPGEPPVLFPEHHLAHAASAYFPSPFEEAAILTLDGVGEWSTSTWGTGKGREITLEAELEFPHSIGLLYSAVTYFCGFKVNSGEYKLMGLAPYGEPRFVKQIRDHLVDVHDDGSIRLALDHFGYLDGLVMTSPRFDTIFGGPPRKPEDRITRREMDLARSIQDVLTDIVLRIGKHVRRETGQKHLTMAGGVSLNCVANGELLRSGIFDQLWIQPAAGDAGGAIGAALAAYHLGPEEMGLAKPRTVTRRSDGSITDGMRGAYLGPLFPDADIKLFLEREKLVFEDLSADEATWASRLAELLASENVVGLFQGRMEVGPRALGHRSIVGDPRSARMQSVMNLKIKQRESFRPFAPAVLAEHASEWFELDASSPYMLLVAPVREEHRKTGDESDAPTSTDLLERVNRVRSSIPAVTHVDFSARVQTVHRDTSPRFHALISAFHALTGCPVLVNTSFNVRGEPIVGSPEDAFRCFMSTEMDYLALGPFLLERKKQPGWEDASKWRRSFEAD
ncbi:MAG: carbamoyltransferase [Deltaproteobacteria bacterium]|nr:carbamoyltransferase [Deltaproteobacteria bacterium]